MLSKDLEVGKLYSTSDGHRVELLENLGGGDWRARWLDPPHTDKEGGLISRDIVAPWRSPSARAVEQADRATQRRVTEATLAEAKLWRLGARFSSCMADLDDTHGVEISSVAADAHIWRDAERADKPGLVRVELPEPVLRQLLLQLGANLDDLEQQAEADTAPAGEALAQLLG